MAKSSPAADGSGPSLCGADGEPLVVGQRWVYRKGARDQATCVEVRRLGASRPPRVRVRFLDDSDEGREEWVPPGRLKTAWEHVDEWQAREDRWAAAQDLSEAAVDSFEETAAGWVFDTLYDWNTARRLHGRNDGIVMIQDVDRVTADLGSQAPLLEDPAVFTDDDVLIAPWPVTYELARTLACTFADRLLPELDNEDRAGESESRWGWLDGSHYVSPEVCAQVEEEYRPARALVREWCGAEARQRQDELIALREEVMRLGGLIERAITALRQAGADENAHQLELELGVPVEVLRQAHRAHQRESGS